MSEAVEGGIIMKNKTLCLLLSALLVAFLFGCGGGGSSGSCLLYTSDAADECPAV